MLDYLKERLKIGLFFFFNSVLPGSDVGTDMALLELSAKLAGVLLLSLEIGQLISITNTRRDKVSFIIKLKLRPYRICLADKFMIIVICQNT